ncbi:MAG: type II secretion system F family protein [Magnetococcus sp. WYHC-3]
MPNYSYVGRRSGEHVTGTLRAPGVDAVVEALTNRGIEPLSIKELGEGPRAGSVWQKLNEKWPSVDDLILFTRQMYTLARSGVPLVRAFQGLMETTPNRKLVAAMQVMVEKLQGGMDLSATMAEHPRVFPNIYTRIVRMGEDTGRLEEAFKQLFEYLEIDKETRQQIKSALRYPSFVVTAIVVAMFLLNYFVIPQFASVFAKFGSELPIYTKLLLGMSNFTKQYWYMVVGGIGGAVVAFRRYIATPQGLMWWDRYKMRMPLVGSIINRATLARFSRSYAMGARSGLPVVQTLRTVAEAVDNVYVKSKVAAMRDDIERGDSLTEAAYASGLFTPLVLQMMAVGEETGGMEEMMAEVAGFYEREVAYEVKGLTQAIEPILLSVVGVMVLVLALGIFVPMWDLGGAATKGKH